MAAEENKKFSQDLQDKAEVQNIYFMHLLFREKPEQPDIQTIQAALTERFGEVDVVNPKTELASFAIRKYPVTYKDDAVVPAQVLIMEAKEFEQESIDGFARSQLWNVPDGHIDHYLML